MALHFHSNFIVQCPLLYRITLGQHKSDNNNRMIQFTDAFCVLFRYDGTKNIWLQYAADSINRDLIKGQALFDKHVLMTCLDKPLMLCQTLTRKFKIAFSKKRFNFETFATLSRNKRHKQKTNCTGKFASAAHRLSQQCVVMQQR